MIQVSLGTSKYRLSQLLNLDNQQSQKILENHYNGNHRGRCHCINDRENRELIIKKRKHFYLSKAISTKQNHARSCSFYNLTDKHGSTSIPAIIEKKDGRLNIKLDSYITKTTNTSNYALNNEEAATNSHRSPTNTRYSTTLLGLLQYIFEHALLNIWDPNKNFPSSFNSIANSITNFSEKIDIGRKSNALSSLLFIPRWHNNGYSQSAALNHDKLFEKTNLPGKAAIVIGEVTNWLVSKNNGVYGIKIKYSKDALWMPNETATLAMKRFKNEISGISKENQRILTICIIFRKDNSLRISDISFMCVSPDYVPADSSYELAMISKLTQENRKFKKPLCLNGNKFLPDFILLDTQEKWIIEVFGMMNDSEYNAHTEEKIQYYENNNIPFLSWFPEKYNEIPNFPA